MRRCTMWLAAGLLALGPGMTLAGPLSFLKPAPKQAEAGEAAETVIRGQNPNDDKAKEVARAIGKARVGKKIQVAFQNGVAVLKGPVTSAEEAQTALKAAASVKGVRRVENHLSLPEKSRQAVAQKAAPRQRVQQTAYQPEVAPEIPEPDPNVVAPMAPPMPEGPIPTGPVTSPSMGYGGPGGYGPPSAMPQPYGMPSHMVYDQPNIPNHAWPSYAAYPNSAAVSYPQQYSASAWPYIGPFYPYPQVPLGWRKVQLEWDDGYWQLNFRPRTDRWWWFMDYRNW